MKANITYRVGGDITAFIDNEKVAVCYCTGYVSGKNAPKIEFQNEDERLSKFIAYCESKFNAHFEVVTEHKYHLKWNDGIQFDIYATTDEEAIKIGNSYFNPNSGSITQSNRFVGNINEKPPLDTQIFIPRRTWKRKDRTNPRYVC